MRDQSQKNEDSELQTNYDSDGQTDGPTKIATPKAPDGPKNMFSIDDFMRAP